MAIPGASSLNTSGTIGSLWDGLSPHLIASIYEVNHKSERIGDVVVRAVFADDANLEATFNWQSPFEQAGPESRAPALMAMAQSGALQPLVERLGERAGNATREISETARGRTGITKLNSTQVFSGMPPLRIQSTLLLRAWRDPDTEVERPLDQLMQWGLPRYLAPEGTMLGASIDFLMGESKSVDAFIEAAMPSEAPSLIAISYKGRTYAPMVIESIGVPLHSPIDKLGRFVQLELPVTFSTLTAKDRNDWTAMRNR